MGSGRYNDVQYRSYTQTISSKSTDEVFQSTQIKKEFNPKNITLRESCDSEDSPNSVPIILAMDVTGSMGKIPEYMIKTGIGDVINSLLEKTIIKDPHIMIMAVGDHLLDSAPLQVCQFEADNRIQEQLQDIWLEGHGGGNSIEGYHLPWIFAAEKTKIDCFNKRNKKGYLFGFGDEHCPKDLSQDAYFKIFGNKSEKSFSTSEIFDLASEKYNVFHLIIEEGDFAKGQPDRILKTWTEVIGNRAIPVSNYKFLSEIIIACISLAEGISIEEVLSVENLELKEVLKHAFQIKD